MDDEGVEWNHNVTAKALFQSRSFSVLIFEFSLLHQTGVPDISAYRCNLSSVSFVSALASYEL